MSRPYVWDLHPSGGSEGYVARLRSGAWSPEAITLLTAEDVRDIIGAALVADTGITITVNDAGDTITVGLAAPIPTTAAALTTRYQPAVAVVGGVPDLVYDAFDQLVMVEVPNP